jgi:hypothetical protein
MGPCGLVAQPVRTAKTTRHGRVPPRPRKDPLASAAGEVASSCVVFHRNISAAMPDLDSGVTTGIRPYARCHLQLAIAANWSVSPRIRLRLLPMHPPRAAGMRPCTFHSGIHCESHCLTYSRRSLYQSKIITRALRAHRVIFMIRVLHIRISRIRFDQSPLDAATPT